MRKRLRYRAAAILVLAAAFAGRRFLYPTVSIHAATTVVSPARSYLIILGVGDTAATKWDGSIIVTGSNIQILRGWRFADTDAVSGTTGWTMSTRTTPSLNPPGPVQENGIIVKVTDSASPITFAITTAQGNFSFTSQEIAFGT